MYRVSVSDMYGKGPVRRIPRPKFLSYDDRVLLLEYIRANECKSFEELLGCVLADMRDGVPSAGEIYRLCFESTRCCVRYCQLCADGRLADALKFARGDVG